MQITDYSQVDVIHSTSGIDKQWNTYRVHKSTWNEIEDDEDIMKQYELRRMTVNDGVKKLRKSCLILMITLLFMKCYSQEIEKIAVLNEVKYKSYAAGLGSFPQGMFYNEIEDILVTQDPAINEVVLINLADSTIKHEKRTIPHFTTIIKIKNDYWGLKSTSVHPVINNQSLHTISVQSGISFILKKGSGYIVYYVDKNGVPGAVDTEGKTYTSEEAMGYLKTYDSEKYAGSLERAEELGLKTQFLNNEVLVWGKTYYSTTQILGKQYEKNDPYIRNGLIQYDQNGYGYQMAFDPDKILFCVVNPNGLNEMVKVFTGAELLLIVSREYSSSWYVGFGGNIYYYVAGSDYTEVFRIRRTWGEPDFYAMAINGYTDDDYGAYVNEVLAGLSKADLRLLRNTVFALYGYHFNSADLAAHFDKQVWYTDEGKTTGDITLPEHRARLVEMIQEKEAEL